MIKNLIFDLDNTIIKDEEEDSLYYKEALKKCGYDETNYYKIFCSIDEYDAIKTKENIYYNKEELLETVNRVLNTNYEMKLIDELNLSIEKYWTKRVILKKEVIEKLSKKYNLYVYTNYFQETQKNRLKNIGYLKYFKKVFGADEYGCKPFKKSFELILKEITALPEECVMIGDTKDKDILAANNVGMKSILYDYNGKRDKKELSLKNYTTINNLDMLLNFEKIIS